MKICRFCGSEIKDGDYNYYATEVALNKYIYWHQVCVEQSNPDSGGTYWTINRDKPEATDAHGNYV